MTAWFLAPSLVKLRDEINTAFPGRDKSSDGAVGDTSHAARKSSHNPLWTAPGNWSGVVRAIDVDSNGKPGERTPLVAAVLDAAIGDPRTWYVIWNRQIWSVTHDWKPRPYDGDNPHDHHVHVSVLETVAAWSDTSPWLKEADDMFSDEDRAMLTRIDARLGNLQRLEKIRAELERETDAKRHQQLLTELSKVRADLDAS